MVSRTQQQIRSSRRHIASRRNFWPFLGVGAILLPFGSPTQSPPLGPSGPASSIQQPVEPIVPIAQGVTLDPMRVALGERLFNDRRLSGDDTRSCATCHPLGEGGMDRRARGVAVDGRASLRNTPTLFNVSLNASFNWDGATNTLEAHAERLLTNPAVMNSTWPKLLAKLNGDSGYASAFAAVYPDGISSGNILNALASFERSLLTPNSRFDRYLRGDRQALSAEERRGYELFKSYGCTACHQGKNIGGNLFQKFGVFQSTDTGTSSQEEVDTGRYWVTKIDRDRGVFRVPSLRNVALTAPYFHDGRMPSLEGAVDTMARVQLGRALNGEEIVSIVRFLKTLTGEYRDRPLSVEAGAG